LGDFRQDCALSLSNALVIIRAPLIGACADALANKKQLLLMSTSGCIFTTAALGLAGQSEACIS